MANKGEKMVKVSIVVPIYNSEPYLSQCLNSAISQTLKEIEIICVNDGSSDNSLNIVERFAQNDSRIKIINKKNGGYGKAVNTGMSVACGEYVSILESDDFISKNMLEYLYKTAKKYDVDIVKSDYYEFSSNNIKKIYKPVPTSAVYYNKVLSSIDNDEIFDFKMNTWTGIYRRSFLEENKIFHNETNGASYQDNGFWFQTIALAKRVIFVKKAFYHYRQDNPNSSINSKEKVFCMCDEYDFIRDFLERDNELLKRCTKAYHRARFYNYFYSYQRVSEQYKMDFLMKFHSQLLEAHKNGELEEIGLTRAQTRIMELVLKEPETLSLEKIEEILEKEKMTIFDWIKERGLRYTLGKIRIKLKGK